MSNYVLQDGELRYADDELYHYDVLGETRSHELDRKMQENATKSGVGKTAAKLWLISNTRTYEATKAALGSGGVVARGAAYLNSYLFGGLGATPVRALYVRGYDGKWLAGEMKKS